MRRPTVVVACLILAHQSADGHDVAILHADNGIRFIDRRRGQRQDELAERAEVDRLRLFLDTVTAGRTCSSTLPSSSICGVTSSATPEKKGCSVIVNRVVGVPARRRLRR